MLLALGLSGAASGSDSYHSDVEFDFLNIEDDGSQVEVSVKSVGYRWYFQEVDGMSDPLELQPFLQKSSWAEAAFVWFNDDDTPEAEGSGLHFGARVVLPDKPVGIDVEYLTLDIDTGGGAGDEDFISELGIGAVVWLNDDNNLAVEAGIAFGELLGTMDTTTFDVGARYVMPIEDHHLEIAGRFKTIDVDAPGAPDISGIEVETRFFFNQEIFAGFSFSTVERDGAPDTSNWEVSGGYSSPMGLDVAVSIGEGSVAGQSYPSVIDIGDDPTFGVRVGYRF
jgi:hypothetical protein